MHQYYCKIQDEILDLIPFISKPEAETMYYHQARKQPYQNKFREAMAKEFKYHTEIKHYKYLPIGFSHVKQYNICHLVNETKYRYYI